MHAGNPSPRDRGLINKIKKYSYKQIGINKPQIENMYLVLHILKYMI